MSATSISYNNFSFQTSKWKTRTILHKSWPEKSIDLEMRPRDDGFVIVKTYLNQKRIEIEGMLVCDSNADLRTELDNAKKALRPKEKNLDIDYGGNTIRYKASVEEITVPEDFYHITSLPYKILFLADPLGKALTTNSQDYTGITTSPYTNSISVSGSDTPKPIIKFTVNSGNTLSKIAFKNLNIDNVSNSISVSQSFSATNVLEINCDEKTVQVDSSNVDFEGIFPVFTPATNSFTLTITSVSHNIDLKIVYYPTFS